MPIDPPTYSVRGERFSGGPARRFLSSMDADEALFEADLAVDRAHVVMLAETGVVESDEAATILAGLDEIEAAGYHELPRAEDIHEAIETALIEEVGRVGGKLHTARSRNDEVATCIRYRLRELLLALGGATTRLRTSLADIGEAHAETVMPGYTHLQPAQATTLGHWACSYERPLARDTSRVLDAIERVNQSPLGGAAFAGTPYPIDPQRTAELLGFESTLDNSMDAVSSRDVVLEAIAVAASVSVTLAGLAEDVILFANRGFVELDDHFSSTSSILPQKKNPDTLELVRATAGDVVGAHSSVTMTLKGLPRAYNRDLQSVTPHAWAALDAATEAAAVTSGAISSASWETTTLADAAEDGLLMATDLADQLAMAGMPFREAHALVASTVADLEDPVSPEALQAAIVGALEADPGGLDEAVRGDLFTPEESVARRDSPGGPGPGAMATQLEAITASLEADMAALDAIQDDLEEASSTLREEVVAYG